MSSPSNQLPRVLGVATATAIVVGTVIGSGVFKKASVVSTKLPEFGPAMLAWILVGFLTLIGALILAEVVVIVGKAGGNYAILREAYGEWAGFLWGWVEFWIIRTGSIAALATIFSASLLDILGKFNPDQALGDEAKVIVTCLTIAVLGLVNGRGTNWGGGLQILITSVKVISLVGIAVLPLVIWGFFPQAQTQPSTQHLKPIWPESWGKDNWVAFGGALVGIFWAYHGWMNIAPIAEEVKNPQRNLPLALLLGVATILALYLSVNLAYYLVIPSADIARLENRTAAGEYGWRLFGEIGLLLASAAVMTSVFGSLNGNLLVGPRLLYAMGKDGLAPSWLSRIHPRYQTPLLAVAILTTWSIIQVVVVNILINVKIPLLQIGERSIDLNLPKKDPFDVITDFAMFGAISFETLAVASIFVFRRRYPKSQYPLPYRCPLYPVLPILYVCVLSAVLYNMFTANEHEAKTGLAFILIGALLYLLLFSWNTRLRKDRITPPAIIADRLPETLNGNKDESR
jgi:APA family basic amino acid/polyamine antiporter